MSAKLEIKITPSSPLTVPFSSVNPGEVFISLESAYLKIHSGYQETANAVRLFGGVRVQFMLSDLVVPVKSAQLSIVNYPS